MEINTYRITAGGEELGFFQSYCKEMALFQCATRPGYKNQDHMMNELNDLHIEKITLDVVI